MVAVAVAMLLVAARRSFPVGSYNRPRPAVTCAGAVSWLLAYAAIILGHLDARPHHAIRRALHHALSVALHTIPPHLVSGWLLIAEPCLALAVVLSLVALRSVLRPAGGGRGHTPTEHQAARAIAERWGTDSLSPFIMRPDKAFHFAADGVLAYRLIRDTAVVSGDPVAPPGQASAVLASFRELARERGWRLAIWGASAEHLDGYRKLGLRAVCAGEEAFVDPAKFTLEGRRVRKLRQSVNRVARRGWSVEVYDGRSLEEAHEHEIDALEARWRAQRPRVLGFAMAMGEFQPEVRPDDLYVLARSPQGELRSMMRFFWHCGRLSLDAMRRVGDTPNGLNEALVARALETAAKRGVPQVSLNYAGLAHLVRAPGGRGPLRRWLSDLLMRVLSTRFQLQRLVRFNEKFSPEWRPRFLVYESRPALARTLMRVLQAEGYLPVPGAARQAPGRHPRRASAAASAAANAHG
jgi:lysyl-tRNA synthetase class 2